MKTTLSGILAAFAIVAGEVSDLLDASPTTVFQADLVLAQLAVAWGLYQAANRKA